MFRLLNLLLITTFMVSSLSAQNAMWNSHVIDSSLSGSDGVRLADVNNDKLPDIATGWEESGYTRVYIHPG